MGIVNYAAEKKLLVVVRGHPYDRDALAGAFDSFEAYNWSLVEQPAAQRLLDPELASDYDACVCYDMPGVGFNAESDPARSVAPQPGPTTTTGDYCATQSIGCLATRPTAGQNNNIKRKYNESSRV
ncbi:MAG: hypothetical protein ACJA09_001016 [Alcanivorax sp.]|jgi:hypothetical protein